jgi:hypothetical protein
MPEIPEDDMLLMISYNPHLSQNMENFQNVQMRKDIILPEAGFSRMLDSVN